MLTLVTWNVNGLRAAVRNGFLDWLGQAKPDVVCLQEVKAQAEDVDGLLLAAEGYEMALHSAERKGYSGTATLFNKRGAPQNIRPMGVRRFDEEGRVQLLEYADFTLVNAYFPNSRPERARLDYKLDFCKTLRALCNKIRRSGRGVVICGDFNIAHKDIDLARPKQNRDNPGFYPEECAALDAYARAGYVDVFRQQHPGEPGHYSWWSYRGNARANNVGWRLDYHWVDKAFHPRAKRAYILPGVTGSDHCPVVLEVE